MVHMKLIEYDRAVIAGFGHDLVRPYNGGTITYNTLKRNNIRTLKLLSNTDFIRSIDKTKRVSIVNRSK